MVRIAMLALILLSSVATAQQVEDSVDRFTQDRKIDYSDPDSRDISRPIVELNAVIHQRNVKALFALRVFAKIDDRGRQNLAHSGCHSIDWLVDGKPLPVGETVYTYERAGLVLIELIGQSMTLDQIKQIGSGSSVEYRLCSDVYSLNANQIAAFRIIGDKIDAAITP